MAIRAWTRSWILFKPETFPDKGFTRVRVQQRQEIGQPGRRQVLSRQADLARDCCRWRPLGAELCSNRVRQWEQPAALSKTLQGPWAASGPFSSAQPSPSSSTGRAGWVRPVSCSVQTESRRGSSLSRSRALNAFNLFQPWPIVTRLPRGRTRVDLQLCSNRVRSALTTAP